MKLRCVLPLLVVSASLAACGGEAPDPEVESLAAIETPAPATPTATTTTATTTIDWWAIYEGMMQDLWQLVCTQAEIIADAGIYAFCEAYLDANGYPAAGVRRTIARAICIKKVNAAIDDAVCAITDLITGTGTTAPEGGN